MGKSPVRARRSQNGAGLVSVVVVMFFLAAVTDRPSTAEPERSASAPVDRGQVGSQPTAGQGSVVGQSSGSDRQPVQNRVGPATGARRVALTLDDGPDPRWTPVVLDVLRQYRIRATFCLVGVHVREQPGLVRRIVADGHALCNHTWSHRMNLGHAQPSVVRQQIDSTQQAILTASGGVAPRYFRAPGGGWGPAISAEASRAGMTLLGWSVDPVDWAGPPAKEIINRVLALTQPGSIVLLHDGYGNRGESVAALRVIVPTLLDRGFRFVTP